MKNKLLKRAHLTEKTCHEIIQLFAADLTATQIANSTGVSRVTINNYLKLIRTQIAKHCEGQMPFFFNKDTVANNNSINVCYGFYQLNGEVYTDWLYAINKQHILEMKTAVEKKDNDKNTIIDLKKYTAIGDFYEWILYRLDNECIKSIKTNTDDITLFWSNTKNRLLKFRGLNKNTLYLHVKECQFRFNHRNKDINTSLLNIIYEHPLHFCKA